MVLPCCQVPGHSGGLIALGEIWGWNLTLSSCIYTVQYNNINVYRTMYSKDAEAVDIEMVQSW